VQATDKKVLARKAKIIAIEEELGIFRDGTIYIYMYVYMYIYMYIYIHMYIYIYIGTTVPLTLRQRMLFGTSEARLKYKLTKVCRSMCV
jgi:hypothetical protein